MSKQSILQPKSSLRPFLVFFISFLLLFFVTDIKSLLYLSIGFLFTCIFYLKLNLKHSLFLLLLFTLSFEKGIRGWKIPVVTQLSDDWLGSYSFYYGVSLRTLVSFSLFSVLVPEMISYYKKLNSQQKTAINLVVAWLTLVSIGILFSSDYFTSLFGYLRILQSISIFMISAYLLMNIKIQSSSYNLLTVMLVFNCLLAAYQNFLGGPVGLFLEDTAGFNGVGYFTSDGSYRLYRASSLIGHPTFFASLMTMIFPLTVGYWLSREKNKLSRLNLIIVSLLTLITAMALYYSFVRSGWFVFFGLVILLIWYQLRLRKIQVKRSYILPFGALSVLIAMLNPVFVDRVASSLNFFSASSGRLRILLMEQYLQIIDLFPMWGAGLNLSTRAMYFQSNLPNEILGSIYPVHNTLILMMAEMGIISTLLFFVFIGYVLLISLKNFQKNIFKFGSILAILAFIFNSLVHPLFSQDPSFDLLMLVAGGLVAMKDKK